MGPYHEIIKDDVFKFDDKFSVDTDVNKMCWNCETKKKTGYMVWDSDKLRRFFICEDCFSKLSA